MFAALVLSGCGAISDGGGLLDNVIDPSFHADSKQMRVLRASAILALTTSMIGSQGNAQNTDYAAAMSQIITASTVLGRSYAIALSADCGIAAQEKPLCRDNRRLIPGFELAMAEAVGPVVNVAVMGLPRINGAKLLASIAEGDAIGALSAAWQITWSVVRSGRWMTAGYRDGLELQAVVLKGSGDKEIADLIDQAYDQQGSDLARLADAVQSIYDTPALAGKVRKLKPDAYWVGAQYSLIEEICTSRAWPDKIKAASTAKKGLPIDAKAVASICKQPLMGFRSAFEETLKSFAATDKAMSDLKGKLFLPPR